MFWCTMSLYRALSPRRLCDMIFVNKKAEQGGGENQWEILYQSLQR